MSIRSWIAALLVVGMLAVPVMAADESAPESTTALEKAEGLFKAGKIAEARDAFAALVKADPENEELQARAEMMEQVLELQAYLETEEVSPVWERGAVILHAFFHKNDLPAVALAHDKKVHAKADSAMTASLVAETLLVMNKNQEAATFIDALREGQKDDQNFIYRNIAMARLGKMEEARKQVTLYGFPKTDDPGILYDLARLQTLMGEHDQGLQTLQTAFEKCPPRAIDSLKSLAKTQVDFKAIRETAKFAEVMKTASKATGGCGGGCGGCDKQGSKDCEGCPSKAEKQGDCCGSCGDKAAKTDGACSGSCDDCPSKGACKGKQGDCCGSCGDAAKTEKQGSCCGACKTGGECTEDCNCPNKTTKTEEPAKECCGSCK